MRLPATLLALQGILTLFGVARADTDAERLDRFLAEAFAVDVERSPALQNRLGLKQKAGEWENLSPGFQEQSQALLRANLARLADEIDPERLDASARLSYRLYVYLAERRIEEHAWRHHEYVLNHMSGWNQTIPATLINLHAVTSLVDAENYLSRVRGVPRLMQQALELLKQSAEQGIVPPRFALDRVIADGRAMADGAPVLADFTTKATALAIGDAEKTRLLNEANSAIREDFTPAFETMIRAATALRERAGVADGVWRLPDGSAYYAFKLRSATTSTLDAEAIHQLGLREVKRVRGEMQRIVRALNFDGTPDELIASLHADRRFYYPETDAGRAAYIAEAEGYIARMRKELPRLFLTVPSAEVRVRRIDAWREKGMSSYYQRPSADGSRPGAFHVNLHSMRDAPRYQIEALTYHETIPGHHMVAATVAGLNDLPQFRRVASFAAYSEGWALYAELLPAELGLYRDAYADFGRLMYELRRAARLVVDTGIHSKRWSRERGIAYLREQAAIPEGVAVREVERYVVLPAQATAYQVGMLRILDARARARAILGKRFDLREFNETVLRNGPLPMDLLEAHVTQWAQAKAR